MTLHAVRSEIAAGLDEAGNINSGELPVMSPHAADARDDSAAWENHLPLVCPRRIAARPADLGILIESPPAGTNLSS
jgi:hypothetical protein